MPNLKLNPEGFRTAVERAGLAGTNELARMIGMDRSAVCRIVKGKSRPTNRFIAGVWSLFGVSMLSELFINEEEKKSA